MALWWTLLGCFGLWLAWYAFSSFAAMGLALAAAFAPAIVGAAFARPPVAMSLIAVSVTLAIVVMANLVYALSVIPDTPAPVLACYAAGAPSDTTEASFDAGSEPAGPPFARGERYSRA